jgi:hypothetical protein
MKGFFPRIPPENEWIQFCHRPSRLPIYAIEIQRQSDNVIPRGLCQRQVQLVDSALAQKQTRSYKQFMPKDILGIGQSMEAAELMTRELRQLMLLFLQPTVSEAGGLLGDVAHLGRVRILKVLTRSKEKLAQSGLEPQPVQRKTLLPLLHACALEDDDDMLEFWSNLLASAASGDSISPLFVQTLSALSPEDARLLDSLRKLQRKFPTSDEIGMKIDEFRLLAKLSPDEYRRRVLILFQLGLVGSAFERPGIGTGAHYPPIYKNGCVSTTPFGDEFLAACTRPPGTQPTS